MHLKRPIGETALRTIEEIRHIIATKPLSGHGKKQASISLSCWVLDLARQKSAAEGRSVSAWLENLILNMRDAEHVPKRKVRRRPARILIPYPPFPEERDSVETRGDSSNPLQDPGNRPAATARD